MRAAGKAVTVFSVLALAGLALTSLSGAAGAADQAPASAKPDATSGASYAAPPPMAKGTELPTRKIPNIPAAAEAYYAPDDYHVIAQAQDPAAQKPEGGRVGGALTYIFTDDGKEVWRVNDHGQDACSYFFPDQKRIVWTSTKDRMDMPLGDWSNQDLYPRGAELYTSDLKGKNIQRLTNNEHYEAEVSISPNGQWIVFGRSVDGNLNIFRMRSDGTGEEQVTFTTD